MLPRLSTFNPEGLSQILMHFHTLGMLTPEMLQPAAGRAVAVADSLSLLQLKRITASLAGMDHKDPAVYSALAKRAEFLIHSAEKTEILLDVGKVFTRRKACWEAPGVGAMLSVVTAVLASPGRQLLRLQQAQQMEAAFGGAEHADVAYYTALVDALEKPLLDYRGQVVLEGV